MTGIVNLQSPDPKLLKGPDTAVANDAVVTVVRKLRREKLIFFFMLL